MNLQEFDIEKFDEILERGLCSGVGDPKGQMCIEAAICNVLGMEHSDDPQCVADSVRAYKIRLNDSSWSSAEARAKGLRSLGLAQLGSLGVVDNLGFSRRLSEKTVRVLIPKLFREVFKDDKECLAAADRCEAEGTLDSAVAASYAASRAAAAAYTAAATAADYTAVYATTDAANAASYAAAGYIDTPANYAAYATAAKGNPDEYLLLSAELALETLKELKSPGVELL